MLNGFEKEQDFIPAWVKVKYSIMVLFPDNTHAAFEASFTKPELMEYEESLQLSPYVKTWVITKN